MYIDQSIENTPLKTTFYLNLMYKAQFLNDIIILDFKLDKITKKIS